MINNSKFQWLIGTVGLLVVIAACVYLYTQGGDNGPGVPPGQRLHQFVAPLATSDISVSTNLHPVCDQKRVDRRGLRICGHEATVLAFFATGSKQCIRSVDAVQSVASQHQLPATKFAAVAVGGTRSATLALVFQNHWRIPVAYDPSGAIGERYNVQVCPLIEVVKPDGVVAGRLLGDSWIDPAHLGAQIHALLNGA